MGIGSMRAEMKDYGEKLIEEGKSDLLNLYDSYKAEMVDRMNSFEQQSVKKVSSIEADIQALKLTLENKDGILSSSIDHLKKSIQRMQSSIIALEGKVDLLMESTIPTLSERVAAIEAIAKQNDRRLETVETDGDRVKRTGVSREELDSVRSMLFELQGSVMQNSGKVLEIVTQLSSFKKADTGKFDLNLENSSLVDYLPICIS